MADEVKAVENTRLKTMERLRPHINAALRWVIAHPETHWTYLVTHTEDQLKKVCDAIDAEHDECKMVQERTFELVDELRSFIKPAEKNETKQV